MLAKLEIIEDSTNDLINDIYVSFLFVQTQKLLVKRKVRLNN